MSDSRTDNAFATYIMEKFGRLVAKHPFIHVYLAMHKRGEISHEVALMACIIEMDIQNGDLIAETEDQERRISSFAAELSK